MASARGKDKAAESSKRGSAPAAGENTPRAPYYGNGGQRKLRSIVM